MTYFLFLQVEAEVVTITTWCSRGAAAVFFLYQQLKVAQNNKGSSDGKNTQPNIKYQNF